MKKKPTRAERAAEKLLSEHGLAYKLSQALLSEHAKREAAEKEAARVTQVYEKAEARWRERSNELERQVDHQVGCFIKAKDESNQLRHQLATLQRVVEEKDRVLGKLAKKEREESWQACTQGRSHTNIYAIMAEDALALTPTNLPSQDEKVKALVGALEFVLRWEPHTCPGMVSCPYCESVQRARAALANWKGNT